MFNSQTLHLDVLLDRVAHMRWLMNHQIYNNNADDTEKKIFKRQQLSCGRLFVIRARRGSI